MTAPQLADTDTQQQPATPWMTVREAATYSRRHYKTVLRALQEYARGVTNHRALAGFQADANCMWSVHRDDVDRWVRRMPPTRARRIA